MGALMGAGVGLTIGFIFGSYSIMRYIPISSCISLQIQNLHLCYRGGAGPRGFLATLSQYMLSSAATFSFFLAIGSVGALPFFAACYSVSGDDEGNSNGWSKSYSATPSSCALTADECYDTIESRGCDTNEVTMGR
jgi:hypothetical protein